MVDIRDFISLLKHSRGDFAGQPFSLGAWQSEYLDKLFNTKRPDGLRRFRSSFLCLPRKNGKTAMAAAIGLYMLCCDDIGAEVIVAAGDRSQASLLHTAAKQFVEGSALSRRCKVYRNSIVFPERSSSMIVISSEAGTKHGYNPSCCLIDEYHVFQDRELVDVLETGTGSRSQPLIIYVTTAGTDMLGPCYKDWQRAEKIRDGVLIDETFLPCIYAAPDDADPFAESTWKLANPNYGITLKPEYFQQMSIRAQQSASEETVFRTLHLNQWVKGSATKLLRQGIWEKGNLPLRSTDGRPCWCGIDLSSTQDTTAFTAVWPDEDGTFDIQTMVWIPEESAYEKEKKDRVPYAQWVRDGYVRLTDGDVIDIDVIRDWILSFCEKNTVRGVAIDRWNAQHLTTQLVNEGINVIPYGQGFQSMSSPTTLFATTATRSGFRHAGNPVLAWQASNLQVKTDDAGNTKPTKKNSHSTARIDAVVAMIMALGISEKESHGPVYEPTIMVM